MPRAELNRLNYPVLREVYDREVVPRMQKELGYNNRHEVPKVVKVVVNAGIGEASADTKYLDQAVNDLSLITGQRPVVRRAKKAVAAFKLRRGHPVGVKVTLRGARCFHFLEKLFGVVLPRVRDFRGLSPGSFDGRGNYNLGLKDQTLFLEVDPDKVERSFGMDISIITTAKTDQEGKVLLKYLGLPLR